RHICAVAERGIECVEVRDENALLPLLVQRVAVVDLDDGPSAEAGGDNHIGEAVGIDVANRRTSPAAEEWVFESEEVIRPRELSAFELVNLDARPAPLVRSNHERIDAVSREGAGRDEHAAIER